MCRFHFSLPFCFHYRRTEMQYKHTIFLWNAQILNKKQLFSISSFQCETSSIKLLRLDLENYQNIILYFLVVYITCLKTSFKKINKYNEKNKHSYINFLYFLCTTLAMIASIYIVLHTPLDNAVYYNELSYILFSSISIKRAYCCLH